MENYKDQSRERNVEAVASTQERLQDNHASTRRTNINDINKRNAEQEKQEKKSSYTLAGIIVLLTVFIIGAVYFFN